MGLTVVGLVVSSAPGATITPVLPPNGETKCSGSPTLGVWITGTERTNLDVVLYGRSVVSHRDFTVVVLPDTQFYTSNLRGGSPDLFTEQTDWIVANRLARNILFVVHTGDCVDNGDYAEAPWWAVTNALYRLEDPLTTLQESGIPYSVAVGNHDGATYPYGWYAVYYNRYFGVEHFQDKPYYAGHFGNKNNNHYSLFSASGMDFIVLEVEFASGYNPNVMNWANEVLQRHRDRRAIVVSHSLLFHGPDVAHLPFSPEGRPIYDALKSNTNVFLMLCGHDPGGGRRREEFNGHTINLVMADYEAEAHGGNGWLRLLEFSPSNNVIRVKTYSPFLKRYWTEPGHQFSLSYDMRGFAVLQTLTGVSPGLVFSGALTNLPPGPNIEWYAEVNDGEVISRSRVSQFKRTSAPIAPRLLEIGMVAYNEQGHTLVCWQSVGGKRYRLEYSDGDAQGGFTGDFQEILRSEADETDPAPPGTAGVRFFVDDFALTGGAPAAGARYYRVKTVE